MFSDPVVGESFFGRQEIINLLSKRATALKSGYRQNVAIIGHRQLGKTSILRQFLHVFKDPQILCIYVEIKLQAADYFIEQFIRSLLYQFLNARQNVEPTETLADLTRKAAPMIPQTVARIEQINHFLKNRRQESAYACLFELCASIKEETGKSCIVILDEFHRLGEFGIKSAFADFGRRIMVQKHTMYLLSSSSFQASRKILAEKLALLFGNFERVYLKPFSFDDSFDFLEKQLAPVQAGEKLRHFITAFTDGHPFFLNTITARCKEISLAKQELELTDATVAEVLLQLLFESQGILNQFFMQLISPWTGLDAKGCHILLLTALANGKNKVADISETIHRGKKEITRDIRELMERELVVKSGIFYKFHNKVFKFWLREVYEKKELSLLETKTKSDEFIKRVLEIIAEFEEFLALDISDCLADLFKKFNNDTVEFGEKRRRLPHFTEVIKTSEMDPSPGASTRGLIAKGHGRCWLCQITAGRAGEKEVLELIRHGAKKTARPPTKVLVALQGCDENAKLLAKEKRILTLNLSRLNHLMDIYGNFPVTVRSTSHAIEPAAPAQ